MVEIVLRIKNTVHSFSHVSLGSIQINLSYVPIPIFVFEDNLVLIN